MSIDSLIRVTCDIINLYHAILLGNNVDIEIILNIDDNYGKYIYKKYKTILIKIIQSEI